VSDLPPKRVEDSLRPARNIETVEVERVDEVGHAERPVLEQVDGERIAQFGPA
jgi:hypothetical protein